MFVAILSKEELEKVMKHISLVMAALLVLAPVMPSVAQAQPAGFCPPGLAKKNPPCVPPGLVGKDYRVGDRYDGDRHWQVEDRTLFGLPRLRRGESYYRVGDSFLRVDDDTRLVLELLDVLTAD